MTCFNLISKHKKISVSLIILIIAYFYLFDLNKSDSVEKRIINSWADLVKLPQRKSDKQISIAVGTNTNVDLILSAKDLFKKFSIETPNSFNHPIINNLKEFKECFKYFFQKGSAAERSIVNLNDFKDIILNANHLKKQEEIGGNAALMAQNIASKFNNINVILVGPIGQKLKTLLHERILTPLNTDSVTDEIHLIMEYGANELFEGVKAPAANRFIVSHDIKNSEMTMLDDFFNIIKSYKPDIIIISGLHLIEVQSENKRMEKLLNLINHLKGNNLYNIVHLELASIGSIDYMRHIIKSDILKHINSLGLNEQELFFLAHSSEKSPHSSYYKEIKGQPEINKVIDVLEWILNNFGKLTNTNSKLSRIHFHCLIFHIIVTIDNEWSNSEQALVAGTKIASKQACGLEFENEKNEINLEDFVELKIDYKLDLNKNILIKSEENNYLALNSSRPVIEFNRNRLKFALTPVLVCKDPKKTVGLGDSISSVGLVYSHFNN